MRREPVQWRMEGSSLEQEGRQGHGQGGSILILVITITISLPSSDRRVIVGAGIGISSDVGCHHGYSRLYNVSTFTFGLLLLRRNEIIVL